MKLFGSTKILKDKAKNRKCVSREVIGVVSGQCNLSR